MALTRRIIWEPSYCGNIFNLFIRSNVDVSAAGLSEKKWIYAKVTLQNFWANKQIGYVTTFPIEIYSWVIFLEKVDVRLNENGHNVSIEIGYESVYSLKRWRFGRRPFSKKWIYAKVTLQNFWANKQIGYVTTFPIEIYSWVIFLEKVDARLNENGHNVSIEIGYERIYTL